MSFTVTKINDDYLLITSVTLTMLFEAVGRCFICPIRI